MANNRAHGTEVQSEKSTRTLLKILPFVRGDWYNIVLSLGALVGVVLCEMGMPILIKQTIDSLTAGDLGRDEIFALLARNTVLFFLLLCGVLVFSYFQSYLMQKGGQGIMLRIRQRLFNFMLSRHLRFFSNRPLGKIISVVSSDVEGLQQLFSTILSGLIRNLATIAAVLITMFILSPRLTLLTFVTLPIIVPIGIIFSVRLKNISHKVRAALATLTGYISEHIAGMEVIQIFGREKADHKAFTGHNYHHYRQMLGEVYTQAVFRPLIDLLTALSTVYIFTLSARLQAQEIITVGITVAFLNLIGRFFQQISSIADNFLNIQSAASGIERVFTLLENTDDMPDALPAGSGGDSGALTAGSAVAVSAESAPSAQHSPVRITRGGVKFKNVSFGYRPDQHVLKKISFTIRPQSTVALVGYTGSGKSTVAKLMTRLWDVNSGTISIDNHNLRTIPNAELRRSVAMVNQQVSLFDDTVYNNICLGADLTHQQVVDAARVAQADGFIRKLPQGYNTPILGNEGSTLSVGQKQLIAFARVIAHNPKILVLDEATAGIDSQTEHLIQTALRSLLQGRSSLVIAHRLSTIQNADTILALSDGAIIESGTHQELLKARGYYYNLWKYQLRQQ